MPVTPAEELSLNRSGVTLLFYFISLWVSGCRGIVKDMNIYSFKELSRVGVRGGINGSLLFTSTPTKIQ